MFLSRLLIVLLASTVLSQTVIYKYTKEQQATYASFAAYLTAAGTTLTSFEVGKDIPIISTTRIQNTLDVRVFTSGAKFTGNSTLYIGKMSAKPEGQIFDTALTVYFDSGSVSEVYTHWWGNSKAAFRRANNAAALNGIPLVISKYSYPIVGKITTSASLDISNVLNGGKVKGNTGSAVDTLVVGRMTSVPTHQWIDTSITVQFASGSVPAVRPEWWGKNATALNKAIQSYNVVELCDSIYVNEQIVLKSNLELRGMGMNRSKIYKADTGAMSIVYGYNIQNTVLSDLQIIGSDDRYYGLGTDRHGIRIEKGINCVVQRCKASFVEKGIIFYDSSYNCKIIDCETYHCFYSGLGSYAHSAGSKQNKYIQILNNKCYYNVDSIRGDTVSSPSGIVTEETYFSNVKGNTCNNNGTGIRIENSDNNIISLNIVRENRKAGISLYNDSKRNTVSGNQCIDNGVWVTDWEDSTLYVANDTIVKRRGNKWTSFSGIELQYQCNNNTVTGNICYNSTGGIGRQLFGIAVNVRNFNDTTEAECNNTIVGNQCINNEIMQIMDKGYWNKISNNETYLRIE